MNQLILGDNLEIMRKMDSEPFIVNHNDDNLVIHGQVRITLKYNY